MPSCTIVDYFSISWAKAKNTECNTRKHADWGSHWGSHHHTWASHLGIGLHYPPPGRARRPSRDLGRLESRRAAKQIRIERAGASARARTCLLACVFE